MLSALLKKTKQVAKAPLQIALAALAEIRRTIGALPTEHGGVLGGRPDEGVVTEFYFDRTGGRSAVSYTPDDLLLNRLFAGDWNPRGIRFMGFVHSHPGLREPSRSDLEYAKRILKKMPDLERLVSPIVLSAADGDRFEILPFAIMRKGDSVEAVSLDMTVLDADGRKIVDWEAATAEAIRLPARGPASSVPTVVNDIACSTTAVTSAGSCAGTDVDLGEAVPEFLQRVVHAYDLEMTKRTGVACVGTGGSSGFVDELARAGIGQFLLIDPDVVNVPNLATQQTYHRDLGRPKVDALADRIRDINPHALVMPLQRSLDDIDDREFEFLACGQTERRPIAQSLICGFTDSFYAQARVNRLALQFGLPSLCAQVYQEGRGAEITFTHPDVTPACHRCVLSSRYQAYLQDGYENTVTSSGAPVFATTRLNAATGFVALALLHHGSTHPRWGKLLQRIGNRSLLQIRMDPDLGSTVGIGVFDREFAKTSADRFLFDETVWLAQEPAGPGSGKPICPDCHGTGKLRDRIGAFSDTRIMAT